jgi:hypothetical protein
MSQNEHQPLNQESPCKGGGFLGFVQRLFQRQVSLDEYRWPDSVTMLRAVRVAVR